MINSPEEQARARESVKILFWARVSVNHPRKTCMSILLIPIIAIILIVSTKSLILNDPNPTDYILRNDIDTRLYRAFIVAQEEHQNYIGSIYHGDKSRTQTHVDNYFTFSLLLRGRIGRNGSVGTAEQWNAGKIPLNVLSPHGLSLLKRAEDRIMNHPEYKRFCFHDPNQRDCEGKIPPCAMVQSITNHPMLYGRTSKERICGRNTTSHPVTAEKFIAFLGSLYETINNDTKVLKTSYRYLMGTDLNTSYLGTWIIQSRIPIGLPFQGFARNHSKEVQEKAYLDWTIDLIKEIKMFSTAEIDVSLYSSSYAYSAFKGTALRDLPLSLAAICLVFMVIWIHTGSILLGMTAMTQIFLSFPLAYVLYIFVFRHKYFAALQVLVIFLLLGIGADDVFVFTDAWKQAVIALGPDCDLALRMSWTYRRAVKAVTVTSITTAIAFLVIAFSSLMPISTLGVWAATLVIIQYILFITVYPCAIIIWSQRLGKSKKQTGQVEQINTWWRKILSKSRSHQKEDIKQEEYRMIERFFHDSWIFMIYKLRYILLLFALILASILVYFAMHLKPLTDIEQFLPKSHPIHQTRSTLRSSFSLSRIDSEIIVRLVWGITNLNRTGTSRYHPENYGDSILDSSFDFRINKVQQRVLDACKFFGEQRDILVQDPLRNPVDCWIADYRLWRMKILKRQNFETYSNGSEQVQELIRFATFMENGSQPYIHYLNGHSFGFSKDGSDVIFTHISFMSSATNLSPQYLIRKMRDRWWDLTNNFNSKSPPGGNKMYPTGGFAWLWQVTQRNLFISMFTGIGIMIIVSFIVLSLTTKNWLIAVLTTLAIGGVVVTVLGTISLIGWELGTVESISVIIAVGYSFDGSAHITTAYMESRSNSRMERTRDALTDLGISILSGAVSTLFAGMMLLPAVIVPFFKFGILLTVTISSSLLWSLLFLPAMLTVFGPQGSFGSLSEVLALLICMSKEKQRQVFGQSSDLRFRSNQNDSSQKERANDLNSCTSTYTYQEATREFGSASDENVSID